MTTERPRPLKIYHVKKGMSIFTINASPYLHPEKPTPLVLIYDLVESLQITRIQAARTLRESRRGA